TVVQDADRAAVLRTQRPIEKRGQVDGVLRVFADAAAARRELGRVFAEYVAHADVLRAGSGEERVDAQRREHAAGVVGEAELGVGRRGLNDQPVRVVQGRGYPVHRIQLLDEAVERDVVVQPVQVDANLLRLRQAGLL